MNSHMSKAIEHFKEHNFVTEIDVSSVMSSAFRKKLKSYLVDLDIPFSSEAVEIQGNWLYFFYNPDEFPDIEFRRDFFNSYFERKFG